MKWIENGIQFEGTAAEFISIHPNGKIGQTLSSVTVSETDKPKRTHSGVKVIVRIMKDGDAFPFVEEHISIVRAVESLKEKGFDDVDASKISHALIRDGKYEIMSENGYGIQIFKRKEKILLQSQTTETEGDGNGQNA